MNLTKEQEDFIMRFREHLAALEKELERDDLSERDRAVGKLALSAFIRSGSALEDFVKDV